MQEIVLASFNTGKIREIEQYFQHTYKFIPLSNFCSEGPEEDADTFAGNALIKANFSYKISGLPSLADDSGLEVDCLNKAPGVYSSRFAGIQASDNDNNKKLLELMTSHSNRKARFHSSVALVGLTKNPLVTEGVVEGEILKKPIVGQGFGYDPLFFVTTLNLPASLLTVAQKNSIGHRGQAMRKLSALLDELSSS